MDIFTSLKQEKKTKPHVTEKTFSLFAYDKTIVNDYWLKEGYNYCIHYIPPLTPVEIN